jgi:hypothetical protein
VGALRNQVPELHGIDRPALVRHKFNSQIYYQPITKREDIGNTETKHLSGDVPIPLLALLALTTSTDTLQELNPQPWLRKALVYHSATSAVPPAVLMVTAECRSNTDGIT